MDFQPSSEPPGNRPARHRGPLALLFACAATAALSTRWPWVKVQFENLWGRVHGVPAWQSTTGFTCLCTSLLIGVMALAETGTHESQRAVRPGSLMLVAFALMMLAFEWVSGPGDLQGVTAARTSWFYAASIAVPLLFVVCLSRFRSLRRHPGKVG